MELINTKEEIVYSIKNFFRTLTFEEDTHTYHVNNERIPISVSGVVEKFCKPFDAHTISQFVAKAREVSQEKVLKEWEDTKNEACGRGTKVHLFGEKYALDKTLEASSGQEQAIVNFYKEVPDHIIPMFLELQMYHKQYNFAGTADIIFYDKLNHQFIIADFKTNRDLFKNYKGQLLYPPFNDLLDTPFNHYQLQLSLYQLLFEQTWFKIASRRIIWLKHDGTYEIHITNDYTEQLDDLLRNTKLIEDNAD